jgi:hypothetical protein
LAYLFLDLIFGVAGAFNDSPEVNELIVLDLSIMIVVNSIEEFLCRNFAEKEL